ncbi:MAG TPA: MFS transporter, partial [Myxococcaceae bacterium]|nr:MFS transporter [Myxococcaceae bacterium]
PLAGFYLLYFGALGVTLPFFPAYLKSLGLSGSQVGVLLALAPVLSLVAPPIWGHLADRTGRADRVLSAVALGAVACFAPLLWVNRFAALILVFASYAFFTSSVTPLIDTLTLQHVGASGGSFSRVRLFGSLGFVISSTAFGLAVSRIDWITVLVPLCLMGAYFAWSFSIRASSAAPLTPGALRGVGLLGDRELAIFLGATSLHWIACAPFHGTFSIHVQALSLAPPVVGTSAGLGVLAETCFMYFYPRFAERLSPQRLLLIAFVASSARWFAMSLTSRPEVMILISSIHGLTFGAFYVASVAFVSSRVPPELRASGQALFASATFGLGGLIGYLASGVGYDALGGHRLFALAGGVELLAAALVLKLRTAARTRSKVAAISTEAL